ncbi:hypothetical protein AOR01nite_06290 [Acetobacter orleanensis]|uniref:Uncharacterized protein n=1 Tax=Acetobacter orleanensis TaxID=104099 RepID=A0A4Y3TJQ5_9PROT|nr:hypothetical protein Abol_030_088 [Acetobacter orleanensis JCM 7639]GEB82152.1 hypothetical protein AOR01nite_06290 [Acetobacter orleanensis]
MATQIIGDLLNCHANRQPFHCDHDAELPVPAAELILIFPEDQVGQSACTQSDLTVLDTHAGL